MRVVVHHPDGPAAYRLGRIEAITDPLTGITTDGPEVAAKLQEAAKAEYPDLEVTLERLVHNGDSEEEGNPCGEGGTSTWVPADQVPEGARSPKGGLIATHELATEQSAVAEEGGE